MKKKHQNNISNNSQSSTTVANTESQPSTSSSHDPENINEQIAFAEAIWCAIIAEHDASFLMSDHVSKNIFKMFPDSAIAAGFKCCRTKTNYLICDDMAVNIKP